MGVRDLADFNRQNDETEIEELRELVSEMLAALERVMGILASDWYRDEWEQARAAIAKAKAKGIESQSTPPGFSSYAEWREWLASSIAAEDEIKNHYFNDADS